MPVKQVQSATRVLATFEALAAHQPVGVGALARALGDDKSAVQRALMTLADAGWIRRTGGDATQWEVTNRIAAIAHGAGRRMGLRERAVAHLDRLRDDTGETAILNGAEAGRIVVLDVRESSQFVRTAPAIGLVVPVLTSAAGQAIVAQLGDQEAAEFLGRPPTRAERRRLDAVRDRGWSVNDGDAAPGASGVGAPILDAAGAVVGALTVSGPAARMPRPVLDRLGPVVAAAARSVL